MPTRRIFELALMIDILAKPAFGTVRLWAHRQLGDRQPGSLLHGIAEVLVVIF